MKKSTAIWLCLMGLSFLSIILGQKEFIGPFIAGAFVILALED